MPAPRRKVAVGGPAEVPAKLAKLAKLAMPAMPAMPAKFGMPAKLGMPERSAVGGEPSAAVLDPIITMDGDGVIQSASDSVEHVFGWTPEELFGKNVRALIPEPRRTDLDRYLDRYRDASRAKALQRTRRFDAVRKDGALIQIELSVSRADLPANSAPFFIGIVRDVSGSIDVRADSPAERTRLQSLVTEQTRALASANLRLHLADRLASLGTLATGLGHDMNNVLLPVRARLDALEHSGMSTVAHGHVAALRRAVAYLQHLCNGLHFLSSQPEGLADSPVKTGEAPELTDLLTWWRQVGSLLCKALPSGVKVTVSIPVGLPLVKIGRHQLTQAVLNLLVNAGESMPEGRRQERVKVWAKPADHGRAVRFGVSDNGRGMTHAVRRRAFDLFFTTKPRAMGTGLGLALARKVVTHAGGHIEIASVHGRGTTVTMLLPAAAGRRPDRPTPRRSAAVTARDHRTVALVTQILLEAGLTIAHPDGEPPGGADLWVTEPSMRSLRSARAWRARRASRVVMLLGPPPAASRVRWEALSPLTIESPHEFESIRQGIGRFVTDAHQEKTHASHLQKQRHAVHPGVGAPSRRAPRRSP